MTNVYTFRGSISPDKLGVTTPHEHVWLNAVPVYLTKPKDHAKLALVDAPVSIENVGVIRRDYVISKDNLKLNDRRLVIEELKLFKNKGGNNLVELTLEGMGRDPLTLVEVSKETEVDIIMATGWYVAASHPSYVKRKSAGELCEIMLHELAIEKISRKLFHLI
jgi:phosphotriesterase-related protein